MGKNRGEMPDAVKLRCAELRAGGMGWREISTTVGYPQSVCQKWAQRWAGFVPIEKRADQPVHCTGQGDGEKHEWDEGAETAKLTGQTSQAIRTEEDVYRAFEIDRTRWVIDRMTKNAWQVMAKVGEEMVTRQMYGVKAHLKRVVNKDLQAAIDAIYERMANHAPKYTPPRMPKNASGETFLGVISLVDAHAGKLCWAPETGNDYDLKIFESVYRNAVDDLVAESAGRPVSEWLLPIGSDFYHMDNARNTTFNGTPQDVDGRYAKVIEAGEMAVIWAVERLMESAPVSVVWVPGNHDPSTSFHLARTVQAWFRRCERVTVDAGPNPRKYFAWGCNLLGLTHGDQEKPASLPAIMATERPKEWAASTCREWLLGHMHRSRQWQTQGVDTFEGTTVRVLRSLAGTDSWHHRKGFISGPSQKAAEALFYGKNRGLAGFAVVPQRSA